MEHPLTARFMGFIVELGLVTSRAEIEAWSGCDFVGPQVATLSLVEGRIPSLETAKTVS